MDTILVKKQEGVFLVGRQDEGFIPSGDVAQMLGTSKSYVHSLERRGFLSPAMQLPTGRRLYRVADVREFLKGIETGKGMDIRGKEKAK